MTWRERAEQLKFDEKKSWTEIYKILPQEYPEENLTDSKIRSELRRNPRYKEGCVVKNNIVYMDKKEYNEQDVDRYIATMHQLQKEYERINTKQVKATFEIDDTKPVAIALWGDWHEGGIGVDYDRLDKDTETIANTDGLYWIGLGDYKDNYLTGGHPGAQYEQIIQPGMQDMAVKRRMKKAGHNNIALIRGCHDDWDKKTGDKDFIATLCDITNSINLWHGGDLHIQFGNCEYHFKVRHKYKFESSLNPENSMRRIMEMQGPCDVAASAHLHNPYYMERHLMGEHRILCRTGSYKEWDEFSQKLAGYKGKRGIPTIIIFPDKKRMIPLYLEDAVQVLQQLRK